MFVRTVRFLRASRGVQQYFNNDDNKTSGDLSWLLAYSLQPKMSPLPSAGLGWPNAAFRTSALFFFFLSKGSAVLEDEFEAFSKRL